MTFDFFIILSDMPAVVWYWWLQHFVKKGKCGDMSGTTYGVYMQLTVSALLYLTLRLFKILWHTPGNSYQLRYLQR